MKTRKSETKAPGKRPERAEDELSRGETLSSKDLASVYKRNPSAENYVRLRRAHPEAKLDARPSSWIEQQFYRGRELKRFGIDPNLVSMAFSGERSAISELALQLLEMLVERKRKTKNGETHLARRGKAIPDELLDWAINSCVEAIGFGVTAQRYDVPIPADLIVLIRERLCGSNPVYERDIRVKLKRLEALSIKAKMLARGERPSFRKLAQDFDVAPSTVKRWFR